MEAFVLSVDENIDDPSSYFFDLSQAGDIHSFKQHIKNIITDLGFSDYSFIQLARPDIYQPDLSTLPKEMMSQYCNEALYTHDMTLRKALNASECFYRSTLDDYIDHAPFNSAMTEAMNTIQKLNQQYGFYDYYHVPVKQYEVPVLLLVTMRGITPVEFRDKTRGKETSLQILCKAIHSVLHKRFPSNCYSTRNFISINPKPLRVLSTLANNDLTIEHVARKLNISVVTANQHLKTVRASLGVKTNYAAVKRTILAGLIRFNDPIKLGIEESS